MYELSYEDPCSPEYEKASRTNELRLSLRRQEKRWSFRIAVVVTVLFSLPDLYFLFKEGASPGLMFDYGFPLVIVSQIAIWLYHRQRLKTLIRKNPA
jgi:hypothetical protein